MKKRSYSEIVTPELLDGAIENNEYHGFREDYHVIHCLLREFSPKSVLEIGTNMGRGTEIICNAVPDAKVYSLDLPTELAHISLQHPINEGKGDRVGHLCSLPFTQLRGDSMKFDFSEYPCDAYYIDGEHDYEHVYHETTEVLKNNPQVVIYHDTDIDCVMQGIKDAIKGTKYQITRVPETRISYIC